MRTWWLSLLIALLAGANQASAQGGTIAGAEITWFGVYTVANPSEDKAGPGPEVRYSGVIPPTTNSEQVVLRRGIRFGFGYVLTGSPANGRANVVAIFKYASPGIPHALGGKATQHFTFADCKIGGKGCVVGFVVDEPNDLPIGVWTFELHDEEIQKLLAEKRFTASRP